MSGEQAAPPARTALHERRWSLWQRVPGAVFTKEVWTTGKRAGVMWMRTAYALVLLLIMTLFFLSTLFERMDDQAAVSVSRLQEVQQIAPIMTMVVLWCQFIMLSIVGGVMGASAISEERRAGTLATLLTTPLTAWQIVLGKLLGRSVELLILALLSLPLLLGLRVYGGVPAKMILVGSLIGLVATAFTTQVGILCSVRARRAIAPMAGVLAVLVFLWMGLPLLLVVLSEVLRGTAWHQAWFQPVAMVACLPWALGDALTRDMGVPILGRTSVWIPSVALHLVLMGVLFVASTLLLRRAMAKEASGAPVVTKAKKRSRKGEVATPVMAAPPPSSGALAGDALAGEAHPAPKAKHAVYVADRPRRIVSDRPVLWRELQHRLVKARWARWVLGLGGLALLAFIYYMSAMDTVQVVLGVMCIIVAMIASGMAASSSISQEREGRTLEVLLTTPMSGWEIVWGKYVGGVQRLVILPVVMLLHLVISGPLAGGVELALAWLDPLVFGRMRSWNESGMAWFGIPMGVVAVCMPILFLPAVGVLMSTMVKRSSVATAMTLLVGALTWAGLPIVCAIIVDGFKRSVGQSVEVLSSILWINPVFLGGEALDAATHGRSMNSGGFELVTFQGSDIPLSAWSFAGWMGLVLALYVGAAMLCLRWAARTLKRQTGRAK